MPRPAQRLVPVQALVHTTAGRAEHRLDRQHRTPLTVRVITAQLPLQQALLLDRRPSLHSRCVCCDILCCTVHILATSALNPLKFWLDVTEFAA